MCSHERPVYSRQNFLCVSLGLLRNISKTFHEQPVRAELSLCQRVAQNISKHSEMFSLGEKSNG